jgi:hypothetical protein
MRVDLDNFQHAIEKGLDKLESDREDLISLMLQTAVGGWVVDVLGVASALNRKERALRVLEEALELAQAEQVDCTQASCVLGRVYSRPVGDPVQEAGGLGVTVLAYFNAIARDFHAGVSDELARIQDPAVIDGIRIRQAEKKRAGTTAV